VLAIAYSVPRFFLDFFRARDLSFVDGRVLGLTPAQWITPLLAAAGVWLLLAARTSLPAQPAAAIPMAGPEPGSTQRSTPPPAPPGNQVGALPGARLGPS